jgi:hypothetical protein
MKLQTKIIQMGLFAPRGVEIHSVAQGDIK